MGVDLVYDADKVPLCLGEDVACTAYPHGIEGEGNSIQGNVSPVQILHVGKAAVIAADVVAICVSDNVAQSTPVLDDDAFSFFDVNSGKFIVEPGLFRIYVGPSSADLPLRTEIML